MNELRESRNPLNSFRKKKANNNNHTLIHTMKFSATSRPQRVFLREPADFLSRFSSRTIFFGVLLSAFCFLVALSWLVTFDALSSSARVGGDDGGQLVVSPNWKVSCCMVAVFGWRVCVCLFVRSPCVDVETIERRASTKW